MFVGLIMNRFRIDEEIGEKHALQIYQTIVAQGTGRHCEAVYQVIITSILNWSPLMSVKGSYSGV